MRALAEFVARRHFMSVQYAAFFDAAVANPKRVRFDNKAAPDGHLNVDRYSKTTRGKYSDTIQFG